ncbi:MAG: hypothetical protein ABIF09_11170, partial [Gemmatimonadota bacterium]
IRAGGIPAFESGMCVDCCNGHAIKTTDRGFLPKPRKVFKDNTLMAKGLRCLLERSRELAESTDRTGTFFPGGLKPAVSGLRVCDEERISA